MTDLAATKSTPSHATLRPASRSSVRVVLITDRLAVRRHVEHATAGDPSLELLAGGSSSTSRPGCLDPDVAIVDFERRHWDRLLRALWRHPDPPGVLLYARGADTATTAATIVAGAQGLLPESGSANELRHALHVVADGQRYLPAQPRRALHEVLTTLPPEHRSITGMFLSGVERATITRVLSISAEELSRKRGEILTALEPGARRGAARTPDLADAARARRRLGRYRWLAAEAAAVHSDSLPVLSPRSEGTTHRVPRRQRARGG